MQITITLDHLTPALVAAINEIAAAETQAAAFGKPDPARVIHQLAPEPQAPITVQIVDKPIRVRRTKEQIAADKAAEDLHAPVTAGTAALNPEMAPQALPPNRGDPPPAPAEPVKTIGEHLAAAQAIPAVEAPAPSATKDDVRAVLSALASLGADEAQKAKGILTTIGKAAKLSDIPPILYADCVKAAAAAGMTLERAKQIQADQAKKG
jgi:hypothetical protein